ncbi:avidin/streptavidin family protein [Reyranella massiliensis]|uniref:avidin/streptavidin family protein n=1 Tax=Reyranella massiliensis TaxID=445220 RepID=UPI0005C28542
MIRLFACIAFLLSMSVVVQAQSSAGREGTWANDHGSQLVIRSIGPDGSVSGTYANNSPATNAAASPSRSQAGSMAT